MPQTIKPATPLPWNVIGNGYTIWAENEIIFSANSPRSRGTNASKDAAYIVHACNSYPRLVEALDALQVFICSGRAVEYAPKAWGAYPPDCIIEARNLLRELGGE